MDNEYQALIMSIERNASGNPIFPTGLASITESTLTVGTSPLTIAVSATLTQSGGATVLGNLGYISNDSTTASPASFTVAISHSSGVFDTAFTLAQGEVLNLAGRDIFQLKLTRVAADCAFRVNVW